MRKQRRVTKKFENIVRKVIGNTNLTFRTGNNITREVIRVMFGVTSRELDSFLDGFLGYTYTWKVHTKGYFEFGKEMREFYETRLLSTNNWR